MPRKTITSAIQFCLENLVLQDYNKFCSGLLDRREGKRVPRSKVEGKDFLEVVRVLVSTFCENGALQVTLEILRDIDCNVDAEQLGEDYNINSLKRLFCVQKTIMKFKISSAENI